MLYPPITSKQQMYALLARGALGNTIPQYSLEEWLPSADAGKYEWWGVRSKIAGGPCYLNTHRQDVASRVHDVISKGYEHNISVMIDRIVQVTLWAEVYDLPSGLGVYGIEYPPSGGSWREGMPYASWQQNRGHWEGTAARLLLRQHLNPNSLEDLYELMERYPGHHYEFSACDRCYGTLAHRNTITWEMRMY